MVNSLSLNKAGIDIGGVPLGSHDDLSLLCSGSTKDLLYPLVNYHSNGISPSLIGNTSSKGPFSIAMLHYRSVQYLTAKQMVSLWYDP